MEVFVVTMSCRIGFLLSLVAAILVLFSVTSNFLAIATNDWKMPVKSDLVSWDVTDSLHKEMNEATRLKQLGVIFPVRNTSGQIVALESIGDKARTASKWALLVSILFFILALLLSQRLIKSNIRYYRIRIS